MKRTNLLPIESARDEDLRLSPAALRRAAYAARELALRTGTALVVSRDGIIERIDPSADAPAQSLHEPAAGYRRR